MKKIFLSITTIIFLSNLTSCKKNEAEITTATKDTIQAKTKENVTIEPKSKSDELVLQLNNSETEFLQNIKDKKPEEVNTLFDAFRKKQQEIVEQINILEEKLLDDYNSFYDEKESAYVIPEDLKTKFQNFKKSHLELRGIGEGYNEIRIDPDYYSKLVQNKVTPDYKEFLRLEAKDNQVLYTADAGLGITFEEISERVLYWENFITKYPKSKLVTASREFYQMYLTDYLFGMDNTPSTDHETNLILEENKVEYERFLKVNPNSRASKTIRLFIESSGNPVGQQKIHDLIIIKQ
jgi:hypothetical protein